jgi:hypothetical protein
MKTQIARKQTAMTAGMVRELAELAVRVRLMCDGNHLQQNRNRNLTTTGPWGEPMEIEFIDRQPYGFVFSQGQEAGFRVPSGHRFVIEQVNVSSWGDSGALTMHLVTNSPRMYRCIELAYLQEPQADATAAVVAATPLVVNGLSVNTVLFSDRKVHNSPIVPSDTYLQVWGYLESSSVANELQSEKRGASPRSDAQANHNPAAR